MEFKGNIGLVSVDLDDVLYNLSAINNATIKKLYGHDITTMDVNHWNYYHDNYPGVVDVWTNWDQYSAGEFFEGDIDFLNKLKQRYDVQIVTASFPEIIDQKDAMIKQRYGDIKVVHARSKFPFTKDGFLIDDAVHNIENHILNNKMPGIIVDRGYGWNQSFGDSNPLVKRASCFDSILAAIAEFERGE